MDHSALDEIIVNAIRTGKSSYTQIVSHLNAGKSTRDPEYIDGRLIDRRLQTLRRKDRIIYTGSNTRSGWKLPEGTPP